MQKETLGRENNGTGWSEIEHWYWGERTIVLDRENYSDGERTAIIGRAITTVLGERTVIIGKESFGTGEREL